MSNKPDMERVIQVLISLLEEQEHVCLSGQSSTARQSMMI